jgi:integrase
VELSASQLSQLALQFAAAVAPQQQPAPDLPLFGELAHAWYARIAPTRVLPANERRQLELLRVFSLEDETTLTAGDIEVHLEQLGRELHLKPGTLNKVQATGRRVIEEAQRNRLWGAANPFKLARRLKEVERKYELLTLEECQRVHRRLPVDRQPLFRIALHLGLRTGELFALRKEDVDFQAGVVHVHRSHDRDATKTGKPRDVPIVPAVAGDLLRAVDGAQGLLFPGEGGSLQRKDTKLSRVLRTAMAAAGVGVVGVTYKCRRCGRVEEGPAPVVAGNRCGECGMAFWPVAQVRPVRWYDLRHMAATFHHQAGADPVCVALALGHSVRGTTGRVYTHPTTATMRAELSRWALPA